MPETMLIVDEQAHLIASIAKTTINDVAIVACRPGDVSLKEVERADILVTSHIPQRARPQRISAVWVQAVTAGVDKLISIGHIIPATTEITRLDNMYGEAMSEYAVARCFAIVQRIPELERDRLVRTWEPKAVRLANACTVCVVGTGSIGRVVAKRLAQCDFSVTAVNRSGTKVDEVQHVWSVANLHDALKQADIVVLALPLTEATHHLISASELNCIGSSGWIVNISRGLIVDEAALCMALEDGRIGGAALDVFKEEPLPEASPLWKYDNVMVSPHMATIVTPKEVATRLIENWGRRRRGEQMLGLVNRGKGY